MLIFPAQKRVEEDESKIVNKKDMQRLQNSQKNRHFVCHLQNKGINKGRGKTWLE